MPKAIQFQIDRPCPVPWEDMEGEGRARMCGSCGMHVYDIRGLAFCHQMVRSVVGTLVDIGGGDLRPGDVLSILRARDRSASGQVAPAHGLCLTEVGYT